MAEQDTIVALLGRAADDLDELRVPCVEVLAAYKGRYKRESARLLRDASALRALADRQPEIEAALRLAEAVSAWAYWVTGLTGDQRRISKNFLPCVRVAFRETRGECGQCAACLTNDAMASYHVACAERVAKETGDG